MQLKTHSEMFLYYSPSYKIKTNYQVGFNMLYFPQTTGKYYMRSMILQRKH